MTNERDDRAARLAEQLRANLRRRKGQARALAVGPENDAGESPPVVKGERPSGEG